MRQALKAFKPIAASNSLQVLSDNQPVVKFIKGGGSLAEKPLRIREWVSDLLNKQFKINWIKGERNHHADCLSRLTEEVLARKNEQCIEKLYVEELHKIEVLDAKRKRESQKKMQIKR